MILKSILPFAALFVLTFSATSQVLKVKRKGVTPIAQYIH